MNYFCTPFGGVEFPLGINYLCKTTAVFSIALRNSRNTAYKFFISMSELNKEQQAFLNEFNWHNYAEGIDAVDEKNLQEFEDLVTKTFISTDQEEVVEGVVVRITDRDAIVDINAKSEGVISLTNSVTTQT
jgi:small subunit ribosomal protein S1